MTVENKQKADHTEVAKTISEYFEAAKNQEFDRMATLHLREERFSKFNDFPPYERMDIEEDLAFEQARHSSIRDLTYKIDDLRIDILDSTAVATFYVSHTALLVDNYTFRGKQFQGRSRATMLLLKREGEWLIAHEHFSRIPDELEFW